VLLPYIKRVAPSKRKMSDKKTKIEAIKKIIKLVYTSSFLKNEKPLSLLLIAPPEQSKTHFLVGYESKYSHVSTDLSFMGLVKLLQENKNLKQIVIPDFTKITGKKQSTKNNLLTLLNSYLEEGLHTINLGNSEKIDFKGRTGGILTATTRYSFNQNKKSWAGIGFESRFIVVSWKYSDETIEELLNLIACEENTKNQSPKKIILKLADVHSDKKINSELIQLCNKSLRKFKHLKVLLKCIALQNGRIKTLLSDVKELRELNELINFDFTEI
jgi:hypothetical protein